MNEKELIVESTIDLLERLVKLAGFAPKAGLFKGRMGIIIALYSGANHFHLSNIENIADHLLEDLLNEIEDIKDMGFENGLSGIAWGINYLIQKKFIEADSDFFNDIDNLLSDKLSVDELGLEEYLLSGLYLFERFECANLNNCINKYFSIAKQFVEKERIQMVNRFWHLPYWYGLHRVNDDAKIALNAPQLTHKQSTEKFLGNLFRQKHFGNDTFKNTYIPFKVVNEYFFDRLIYESSVPYLPVELVHESFKRLLFDQRLNQNLYQTLNPLNLGLKQSFCGYILSMLQYIKILN